MYPRSDDDRSPVACFSARQVRLQGDEALMHKILALRFQVYCRERGFLDAADYPDGCERDEHDAHSAHFVAVDPEGEVAGYVRMVRPDAIETFPFQNHCVTLMDGVVLHSASRSVEISRLMVNERYRRYCGDSPEVLAALFQQIYQYSLKHGIRYWYAAMEQSLVRNLAGWHAGFRQIGPFTDYYGPVAPFVADLREIEKGLASHPSQAVC